MTTIDLGRTQITPTSMTVTVEQSIGIRAWIAVWTHQDDDFEDGRAFVPQTRDLTVDQYPTAEGRTTRSGTIIWQIPGDGLYEFGNAPIDHYSQTRGFLRVEGGTITRIPYSQKKKLVAALPERPRSRRRAA